MDSSGRIHMTELEHGRPLSETKHTGFVTRDPMPEQCNARKVLSALDKIGARTDGDSPIKMTDAALLPLTPFERGYVLGVLSEYRAWKAGQR